MKLLGLDFETTGTSPFKDRVIEIGYVQWDVERKTPLQLGDFLIKHSPEENVLVSEEITRITGIYPADLSENGVRVESAFAALLHAHNQSDYVVAHNGNTFDKIFFNEELKRLGWTDRAKNIPWIDTRNDLPLDATVTVKNLKSLAERHKIINPFPHRAAFDVLTMLQILNQYKLEEVVALSKIPLICVRANVSYENRELAKARGFFWDRERRQWLKWVKENALEQERTACTFDLET